MCRFARSIDRFWADRVSLATVMARARSEGFRVVRFTGGEPVMHPDLIGIVADVRKLGLMSSIITNGYKPQRAVRDLHRHCSSRW